MPPSAALSPIIRVVTFNCEWRSPSHPHGQEIARRIQAIDPDIVCLTEAHAGYFDTGHEISSRPHDSNRPTRRKVILWSKQPWREVDDRGHALMLAGRYLGGLTFTSLGDVHVHGVVISYAFQDTKSGQPAWGRHLEFLAGLDRLLAPSLRATVLLGDFNQRVPRKYQPQRVFDALKSIVQNRLSLATAGLLPPLDRQAIDHIAHSDDLQARNVYSISNLMEDGRRLSDHFGVSASLLLK